MKNNRKLIITLIIILGILAIGLSIFLGMFLTGNTDFKTTFFKYKVNNELIMDEYYDQVFTKIKVDADASDVEILPSTDNRTHVILHGDEELLEFSNNGECLKVIFKEDKCFGFCFNLTKNKIEIYVPNELIKNIEVDIELGDITIGEFVNADINIDEDCGDVEIASGNNINVENEFGDITIDQAKTVNLNESCGDIKVGRTNDAIIKNKFGKINVSKINNYLNIKDDCGDIILESINLNKDSKIINNFGNIIINDTNDIYIEAKTDFGDTKINNNNRNADITLDIKNDCGDIKVKN